MPNTTLTTLDVTSDTTVGGALAVTGAITAGSLAVTGATTPTGGTARIAGTRTRWPNVQVVAAATGTDTACDNGSIWVTEVHIDTNCTLTGIEFLIGSVGGTDKVCVGLYTAAGVLVANSILDTSVTVGTAANVQQVPFTATYAAKGPQTFLAAVQFNGTTAKLRTLPAHTGQSVKRIKQAGTFATLAAISPLPTALTADVGPILATY